MVSVQFNIVEDLLLQLRSRGHRLGDGGLWTESLLCGKWRKQNWAEGEGDLGWSHGRGLSQPAESSRAVVALQSCPAPGQEGPSFTALHL